MNDPLKPVSGQNIEIGKVKITGGSALILLGAAIFLLTNFVMEWVGAGEASGVVRYGLGGLLVAAGLLWFFWEKLFPKKEK